jgi:hypothetical protein
MRFSLARQPQFLHAAPIGLFSSWAMAALKVDISVPIDLLWTIVHQACSDHRTILVSTSV